MIENYTENNLLVFEMYFFIVVQLFYQPVKYNEKEI